ncbi:hypothetical protein ACFWWC_49655 [Streptomyces sp. NPDC058642]|uniref:hypothetical protein n=1 Tax=Streptomyces sp. NPDC058642 TaxID=3346572 RepID=UPI00364CEFC9
MCRTYDALAAPRPARMTVLHSRLHALSVRLRRHPYWRAQPRYRRRAELRR